MRNYIKTSTIAVLVAAFTMLAQSLMAGVPAWQKLQYEAYLTRDLGKWHQSFELAQQQNDDLITGLAGYGILNGSLASQNEDLFNAYLDDTSEALEKAIDAEGERQHEAMAILSAVLGMRMAYAPWKGMFLGPKSSKYIEVAVREEPNNAIVLKLLANYKYYTPAAFGGDLEEAREAFEKSIAIMEKNGDDKTNWMYLNALAHLGQCYAALGKKDLAKATYEKALQVEPAFAWVEKVLLPDLEA